MFQGKPVKQGRVVMPARPFQGYPNPIFGPGDDVEIQDDELAQLSDQLPYWDNPPDGMCTPSILYNGYSRGALIGPVIMVHHSYGKTEGSNFVSAMVPNPEYVHSGATQPPYAWVIVWDDQEQISVSRGILHAKMQPMPVTSGKNLTQRHVDYI